MSLLRPAVWYRALRRLASEHEGSLYAFLARAWASGAGIILVVLVTTRMTAVEQGYFFTFQTLLTFQFLLELGFAVVLSQFVSHEWAHLRLEHDRIEGDPEAHARLAGMVRLARLWYLGAPVGFLLLVAPGGVLFFQLRDDGTVAWLWPWLWLCLAQVISFQYTPLQALLEGTGDVARSQRALLIANIVAGIGAWLALLAGLGLWAAPLQLALRSALAFALLLPPTRALRAPSVLATKPFDVSWRPEFFRQQMRTAASWSAGLLMRLRWMREAVSRRTSAGAASEGRCDGGEGGIRTHERIAPLHAFQASLFNHSSTSPRGGRPGVPTLCRGTLWAEQAS